MYLEFVKLLNLGKSKPHNNIQKGLNIKNIDNFLVVKRFTHSSQEQGLHTKD